MKIEDCDFAVGTQDDGHLIMRCIVHGTEEKRVPYDTCAENSTVFLMKVLNIPNAKRIEFV